MKNNIHFKHVVMDKALTSLRASLVWILVGFGFLAVSNRALAGSMKLTYEINQGDFVNIDEGNPWGAPTNGEGYVHLSYQMKMTFLMPASSDQILNDPQHASWITPATAYITAFGSTVEFSGPAHIDMYASSLGSSNGAAYFSFAGLYVSFEDFYLNSTSFPDCKAANLLNIGSSLAYVFVGSTYNDIDVARLANVSSVPEEASSLFLVMLALAFFTFLFRASPFKCLS